MRVPMTGMLALGLWASATNAHAAPTARLVFSRAPGAESCPDEGELRRAVAARVGYDPFFAWADKTIVATMAVAAPRGFAARVDLIDDHGVRHGARELLTEQDCSDLLEAEALAIAIAIDPQVLAAPAAPPMRSPPATVTPPAPAEPPVVSPPSPTIIAAPLGPSSTVELSPSPAPGPRVEATAAAALSVGVAPRPAPGFSLGLALALRAVSLGVEGRVDAPTWASAVGGGRVGAWLALGSVVPCLHQGPVIVCALGQMGSMQASSQGVLIARSETLPWRAIGGRFGANAPLLRHLALRVEMDLLGNLTRQTLVLDRTPIWTAPAAAATLAAEVVVLFR